jgi:hypothetical protein
MTWAGFTAFLKSAFSENGSPSSSRIISAWLSLSSMALIWFCARHAMKLDSQAAMVWVGGLPSIIYALGAFTVAPYTIAKVGQTICDVKNGKVTVPQPSSPQTPQT